MLTTKHCHLSLMCMWTTRKSCLLMRMVTPYLLTLLPTLTIVKRAYLIILMQASTTRCPSMPLSIFNQHLLHTNIPCCMPLRHPLPSSHCPPIIHRSLYLSCAHLHSLHNLLHKHIHHHFPRHNSNNNIWLHHLPYRTPYHNQHTCTPHSSVTTSSPHTVLITRTNLTLLLHTHLMHARLRRPLPLRLLCRRQPQQIRLVRRVPR